MRTSSNRDQIIYISIFISKIPHGSVIIIIIIISSSYTLIHSHHLCHPHHYYQYYYCELLHLMIKIEMSYIVLH